MKEAKNPETIRFISFDHDIRLIMDNEQQHMASGKVITIPTRHINFNGPYYHTSNPEEIEHIRGLDSFGKRIFENIVPDDMLQTGTEAVRRYICSFRNCDFVAHTMEGIKFHKKEAHLKGTKASVVGGSSKQSKLVKTNKSAKDEDESAVDLVDN